MNNPFNDVDLRNWLFGRFGVDKLEISVVTTGSGPFDECEFDDFLKVYGITPCKPNPDLEYLIVGHEDWNEDVIVEMLWQKRKKRLKIYSQEMFLSYLLTGVDPYDEDANLFSKFIESHSIYEFVNTYGFKWPTTDVIIGDGTHTFDGNAPAKGFLGYLGYKVGLNGSKKSQRYLALERALTENLPHGIFDNYYIMQWGNPNTAKRLQKMANNIATFCRNMKRRNNPNDQDAIDDWESDLNWLKTNFYQKSRYEFEWPET
jgi:hypothetical protein